MLTGKKAVIFDMDGTLTDSMWIWPEVDRIYLEKYHLTPPDGFAKALEGKSYTETAQYFLDVFPTLHQTIEEVQTEWIQMTLHLYQTKVPLKPGAGAFLEYLKEQQIPMGIATSNAEKLALAALDALQIREYFSSVRTACEVAKGKPAPDVYLKVAEDLQVDPKECLVFEDVPKGIQAGKNAGMTVCAVEDAFSASDEAEKREKADYFIRSYDEIKAKTYERCGV
ncbi:MAG: HAD family phosphatase [[Ruminococcus] gnavus]|nr:HAD family phosphatase [Mediterraneibacter gnavus]